MKTLHIFHHGNLVNGVDKTTCTLLVALKKLGVSVAAVVPEEGDVTDFLNTHNIEFRIIPYACCQSLAKRAQLRFLAESSGQQELLISFIQQIKPELIHINTGHLLYAGLVAAQIKIPTIFHIHSPFEHDLSRYQASIGKEGYTWLLENLSSQIIGVSDDVSNSLADYLPSERINTLYNGIDIESIIDSANSAQGNIRLALNMPKDAKLVIGIGRISTQKNFASFARIAKLVSLQQPNTYFLIVGPEQDNDAVNSLKSEIIRLELSDKIFLLGARLDVPALITQSNCFLSTAIFEGQGIAALEAMALQKPVVAMACVGLRECIENNVDGILVPLGDEVAAAAGIIEVLNSSTLTIKLGDNGHQTVQNKFSSSEYAKQFLAIADKAIKFGYAPVSANSLALTLGLLAQINLAHQQLSRFEKETLWQRCRRELWAILHTKTLQN